ncbi:MAG: protoporphyrinogen oxidase [Candidatus Dormiibacterota bacterium]
MISSPRRVAVIGAGVSGLAAASELARLAEMGSEPLALSVFEASDHLGGKLLTADFSGARVDLGAESLLARGPEIETVLDRLRLGQRLLRPATTSAGIWNGMKMVAIPMDSVLGVPLYPWRPDVVRAVGWAGAVRASLEPLIGRGDPDPDGSLGAFLGRRLGKTVFRRLVDPLLGGVYAGPAEPLSSGAVAPNLVSAAEGGGSLLRGLRRAARSQPQRQGQTPFVSFEGGMDQLSVSLASMVPEGSIHLARTVTRLEAIERHRVRIHLQGSPPAEFEGVILALPAPAAASLLNSLSGDMGSLLRQLEYASVATVTLAYPDAALPRRLVGSGFLVARRPRRTVTACTFLDRKWPHLRQPGLTILRASVGSFGDEWVLALDDTTLVTSVHRELRKILGLSQLPTEVRVERWHGALPQYRAGHLSWRDRVAEAAAALPMPVELTGAAFGGVGIASCLQEGARSAGALWSRIVPSSGGC